MTNYKKIVVTVMMLIFLSACSDELVKDKPGVDDEDNVQNIGYQDGDGLGVETVAIGEGDSTYVADLMQSEMFSDPASPLSKRTIYFEYDSSTVKQEFIPVIEAHAVYLTNNPNQNINLEGHSDERGTREYNIALSEQRAKSVFKMLQVLGVMTHQVNIVSYGEEKPESLDQTEEAFGLNRRVEVVYQ
ncbi:MAG: peptidoglycan-associated lipoprotein Pal [Methyloprofundus sp.]|nr:peptidoglycan-associated lipoprotein Pal [Methyloprofundus sp.]